MPIILVTNDLVEKSMARMVLENVGFLFHPGVKSVKVPTLGAVQQETPVVGVHAQNWALIVLNFVLKSPTSPTDVPKGSPRCPLP
tara:strand:+ start:940 stop:1194 length:255 start_codon:yes stop_codon:yes gene_type:complete